MRSPRKCRVEWEKVCGLGRGASQHLEVWDSEETLKEAEKVVGSEVRQTRRAWSSWAQVKDVLKKECYHPCKLVQSCEDWAMTTGFSNMEIPGDREQEWCWMGGGGNVWLELLKGRHHLSFIAVSSMPLPSPTQRPAQCLAHSGQ